MKRIRRRYLWGSLALLLLALVAGVCVFSETLINDLLRPRLVALASEKLAAEVAVSRLGWQGGVLQIDDLQLRRSDRYALQVPRLRLKLRLADLLERRLTAVAIDSPHLQLQSATKAPPAARSFPARPPFAIGRLALRNGRIDYQLPERSLTLRKIDARVRGGEVYHFSVQSELGTEEALLLQLAGRADWRQGLQLRLERCDWVDRSLLAEPLLVTVPAGDGAAGGGRLHLARFDRAAFDQLSKGLQLPRTIPADWGFVLKNAEVLFRFVEQQWQFGLKLGEGRLQRDQLTLPLEQLDLELSPAGEGWQGQGRFLLAGVNPAELSGRWADGLLQGKLTLQVAEPGRLKKQLLGGTVSELAGGLRLAADFSLREGTLQAQFDLQGQDVGRKGKNYLLNLAPLRLQGDLQGPVAELTGQARLLLDGRELLSASGRSERLELQLRPVSWRQLRPLLGPRWRPQALQEIRSLSGNALLQQQEAGGWAASARLAGRRAILGGLRLDGLSARLRAAGGTQGRWNGSLRLDGRQLSGAGLVLNRLTASSSWRYEKDRLSVSGLKAAAQLAGPGEIAGQLALAGSGFWKVGRWQTRIASLQVRNLEWLSADGLAGLAGGRVDVSGQLDGRSNRPLGIAMQAELAAAEGLWGAYYADLSALPLNLSGRLSWNSTARRLQAEQWAATLAGIGNARGSALLSTKAVRLAGALQVPDLGGQASDLFGQLFAEGRPELAEAVFGGGLEIDFELGKNAGWRLRGEVRPQRLNFELPSLDLALTGLTGRLPFDLTLAGEDPAEDTTPRDGELRFEGLRLGPAQLATTPLGFEAAPNRLVFKSPLVLEVADGRIAVADLLLGRVPNGLLLTGHFTIDDVDLERLTADLGLEGMRGRLDADLGRIRYRGGLLSSEGEALIDAFGGRIRIARIGLDISNLAYPQLTADVDFQAIDLYQLTQTFSFGAMNGVVDGYVRDLRLLGTTPSKFTALLESRPEGRRNISVKALNNLSILSQGGLSAALSRGIYRFIDFYRYRKIGIACELDRDVFYLRGTAQPGSTRYLVYGGALPPKIDIIAPPSAISFSEMLKRLQRIERAD